MNINLKFLLLGTAVCLFPQYAEAQCAETDCLKLGYTKLEKCDNGLKCPFGEYWACPCDTSYEYTCTGANEQPGTDKCGDKYKSCNCASGYEWKDGKCQTKGAVLGQCTGYAKNCKIGQILNSDGTCTTNKENGKTPIGVVVYIGNDNCGQALALNNLGKMRWSTESTDIKGLTNYTSDAEKLDFDSCGNTQKIIQQGDSSKYPAAWGAYNYTPKSIPETKGRWCLPAAGVGGSMMNNHTVINSGLSKAGGEQLPITENGHCNWSSSEKGNLTAWRWCFYGNEWLDRMKSALDTSVRPVIIF